MDSPSDMRVEVILRAYKGLFESASAAFFEKLQPS